MAKSKKNQLEVTQLRQTAYELDIKVQDYQKMAEAGLFGMVVGLKQIKAEKLYKYMGDDGQNTWEAYCSSRNLNRNTIDAYIRSYELYIEEMKRPPELVASVGIGKLTEFRSGIQKAKPEDREELFDKVCTLSRSDLYDIFGEQKLMPKRPIKVTKCLECQKAKISYDQDMICNCRGLGITAQVIVE